MSPRERPKGRPPLAASAPPAAESSPDTGSTAPLDRPAAIAFALILIAALAIYLPRLGAPFFACDFTLLEHTRELFGTSPAGYRVAGLVLFVALLALLFALTRRLAGARAAVVATAIVAVHYAAEIPVAWVSGARVTLAVTLALGALLLHVRGRRWPAAAVLALAALCRESVLVTPLVAAMADRRPGEPFGRALKRAWPLAAAAAVYVVVRLLVPGTRAAGDLGASIGSVARGLVPALVHLPQVVAGFEWRQGTSLDLGRAIPGWTSVALVLLAVFVAVRKPRDAAGRPATGAIRTGIAWAVIAALPASGAAAHWSAHHYLFAVCGAALALGAWLAHRTPAEVLVAVALLGLGSASARGLGEFAGAENPWTGRSHVNRYYLDRATDQSRRFLESLRRARPELPARATLFFDGVQPVVGFQTADGPPIRRAYRDTTLRAYTADGFSVERAARGPVLLFLAVGDSLVEVPASADPLRHIAISRLLAEDPERARDALVLGRARDLPSERRDYLLAWTEWHLGRRDRASDLFDGLGIRPADEHALDRAAVVEALAAGDTVLALARARAGARQRALDSDRHGLLADLLLMRDPYDEEGLTEAWAARVLAPEDAIAWRRWAMIQIGRHRRIEALASLERSAALAGASGAGDAEVTRWTKQIREMVPVLRANAREPVP